MDLTSLGKAFTNVTVDFSKAVVTDNKGKSTISLEKGDKMIRMPDVRVVIFRVYPFRLTV